MISVRGESTLDPSMNRLFVVLITFSAFQAFAVRIGFSSAVEFKASAIDGKVTVTCHSQGGAKQVQYHCREVALDPQAYDIFVGPQETRADKVELKAFHQDGSNRIKILSYDGQRGQSRDSVNLWISTLFQKPLLEMGTNRIQYKLYNTNADFGGGEVVVNVARGAPRTCETSYYSSPDMTDCESQYTICQRYFEQFNYCSR